MFDIYRSAGSQQALRALFKATFQGRRRQIKSGEDKIEILLENCCPLLNQPDFVSIPNYMHDVFH